MPARRGDTAGPAQPGEELASGVQALDHTADVGFVAEAASPVELFDRCAVGMIALLYEESPGAAGPAREGGALEAGRAGAPERVVRTWDLELEAEETTGLLVAWLRELLYLHEVHGLRYEGADFECLTRRRLRARVRGWLEDRTPARELKGVTYHGLEAAETGGVWRARVIFDV